MTNVLKFPKPKRAPPRMQLDTARVKAALPRKATVMGVLAWCWLVIRIPLFLVLYWLRVPVVLLCSVISYPMLFAFLFAWYAFPDKTAMVWGFGTVSLLAFVVMWAYDFVLMALSPQDMVRTL